MLRNYILCTFFMVVIPLNTASGECRLLDAHSSVEELVGFLRTSKDLQPDKRNAECVEFAIRHLEYKPSPEATDLLIDYLSFERPLTQAERNGFMIRGPMTLGNMHPATGTLMTFGQDVVPSLLSAIENPASPAIPRLATYTLMQIFRDKPPMGIEYLKQRASTAEASQAANLKEAQRNAIEWCSEKYRKQCEAASR